MQYVKHLASDGRLSCSWPRVLVINEEHASQPKKAERKRLGDSEVWASFRQRVHPSKKGFEENSNTNLSLVPSSTSILRRRSVTS
jgi:hypothetical protein